MTPQPRQSRVLTTGQRSVLQAIAMGWSHGSSPQARGSIVASLYDRGLVRTGGFGSGPGGRFADLGRWTVTDAGRAALGDELT